jgi:hypothetical protein
MNHLKIDTMCHYRNCLQTLETHEADVSQNTVYE